MLWTHDSSRGDGYEWMLQRCRVAPNFSDSSLNPPLGKLVRRTDWQNMAGELEMELGEIDLSEMMLWACNNSPVPEMGFRYLSWYSDRLAEIHNMPITPLQLITERGETINLGNANVVGRGARSLILRLGEDAECVVKVGRCASIRVEESMHARLHAHRCQFLRRAQAGMSGSVEGAGAGLGFIGLQHFCARQINQSDCSSRDMEETLMLRQKYMNQVRFLAHSFPLDSFPDLSL